MYQLFLEETQIVFLQFALFHIPVKQNMLLHPLQFFGTSSLDRQYEWVSYTKPSIQSHRVGKVRALRGLLGFGTALRLCVKFDSLRTAFCFPQACATLGPRHDGSGSFRNFVFILKRLRSPVNTCARRPRSSEKQARLPASHYCALIVAQRLLLFHYWFLIVFNLVMLLSCCCSLIIALPFLLTQCWSPIAHPLLLCCFCHCPDPN